jgi:hypothetical protein
LATKTDRLAAAVDRHRSDPSPLLEFQVRLGNFLDRKFCSQLQADLKSNSTTGWRVVKAKPQSANVIPKEPGLYMFVWDVGFELPADSKGIQSLQSSYVLYVGQAGAEAGASTSNSTLRSRYETGYKKVVGKDPEALWSHSNPRSRDERLAKYLSLSPLYYWCLPIANRASIGGLETRMIELFNPPLNAQSGRRMKPTGKSVPAF